MPIMPGAPMAIPGCMGMPFAIIMPGCMPMGAGTMPAKDAHTSPSVPHHHNMCCAHPTALLRMAATLQSARPAKGMAASRLSCSTRTCNSAGMSTW